MDIEGEEEMKTKRNKTKKKKKDTGRRNAEELIKRVFKLREVILLVIDYSPIATYRISVGSSREENYKREKRSSRGVGLEGMKMESGENGGDGKE